MVRYVHRFNIENLVHLKGGKLNIKSLLLPLFYNQWISEQTM